MKSVLLHCCCAPCSAAIIEWLLAAGIRPVLYYFNPNIFPQKEYELRKSELSRYADAQGVEVIDGDCDHDDWLQQVSGMEHEPERGARCLQCFKIRLLATAKLAHERGFDVFATSLASSRWKSLDQITQAGRWAASQYADVQFWDRNWRKNGLSERRNELIKQNAFYNQQYCGCEFSAR
jgi:predicted adenine nucleotide alpha hydrolase (AANH) superfamily ATPase